MTHDPVPTVHAQHVRCVRCGYDRYGGRAEAVCPECGGRGWTRHFQGRRRVRWLANMLLLLASADLAFGLGVRMWFGHVGVAYGDFREVGYPGPASARALRAAPLLSVAVHSTNVLTTGSLILIPGALAAVGFSLWLRERRGMAAAAFALALLTTCAWLGFEQGNVMFGNAR